MSEFNTIDEILEDIRAGKPVVILDDENRENEGDVIFAAEHATNTPEVLSACRWTEAMLNALTCRR